MKRFWIGWLAIATLGLLVGCQGSKPESVATGGLEERIVVGGALKRVATRIQRETKQWPKNLAAFRTDPEITKLGPTALDGVNYELLRTEGTNAIYRYTHGDRKSEITIGEARESQGTPTMFSGEGTGG